jgi:NAD-dependent dihydropyrimidine dehydrogenase PreA subunit
VTDACEQCGHCTAACTSNVRVHDEVREYGMVVDPGCMKCMDCVSVCPNDALYFGFGRPSQLKGAPRSARPRPHYDLTAAEEVVLALVFVAAFLAWRGIYGMVPMLMAAGLAGILTFLVWKAWRTLRDANVRLHRFQLRQRGAWTRGGALLVAAVGVVIVLTVHSGAVSALRTVAEFHDGQVTVPRSVIFSEVPPQLSEPMIRHADAALRAYGRIRGIGDGGIALIGTAEVESRIAWLHSCKLQFAEAERILRRLEERHGRDEQVTLEIAELLHMQIQPEKAEAYLRETVAAEPGFTRAFDALAVIMERDGRFRQAIDVCRTGLEHNPENLLLLRRLSLLLVDHDDVEEGIAVIRRTLEIEPNSPYGIFVLSNALLDLDEADEVPALVRRAIELAPDDVQAYAQASYIMTRMGRTDEAAAYEQEAREIAERR